MQASAAPTGILVGSGARVSEETSADDSFSVRKRITGLDVLFVPMHMYTMYTRVLIENWAVNAEALTPWAEAAMPIAAAGCPGQNSQLPSLIVVAKFEPKFQ